MVAYPSSRNSQSQSNTKHRRWPFVIGAVFLVVGIVTGVGWQAGLRLVVNPAAVHQQAQAAWMDAGPDAYSLTVLVVLPLRENSVYEMTVRSGVITDAVRMNPGNYRFSADPPRFEVDPTRVEAYTVPGLLGWAGDVTGEFGWLHLSVPSTSGVMYDAVYGYPQQIIDNTCGPLFSSIPECITRIEVLEFAPAPAR